MAGWFKKDVDVARGFAADLAKLLAPIDDSGVRKQLQDYILTGGSTGVLGKIDASHQASQAIGLYGIGLNFVERGDRTAAVLAGLDQVAPEVGLRYGRVLATLTAGAWNAPTGLPPHVTWLEALLRQVHNTQVQSRGRSVRFPQLSVATLERIMEAAGGRPVEVLTFALADRQPSYRGFGVDRIVLRGLGGYDDAVARHAEAFRPQFDVTSVDDRLQLIEMVAPLRDDVVRLFAEELAELATTTSSQVRAAAAPVFQRCGDAGVTPLRAIATGGKPESRREALRLLHANGDEGLRAWAAEIAGADRAPTVRALVDEWQSRVAAEVAPAEPAPVIEIPVIDWHHTLSADQQKRLHDMVKATNAAIEGQNIQLRAMADQYAATHGGARWRREDTKHLPASFAQRIIDDLDKGRPPEPIGQTDVRTVWTFLQQSVDQVLPRLDLGPAAFATLAAHTGLLTQYNGSLHDFAIRRFNALHRTHGLTLLEISTMLDEMRLEGANLVLRAFCNSWGTRLAADWPSQDVAPFFTLHLDKVLARLTPSPDDYQFDDLGIYRALQALPTLPSSVVDALFAHALGTRKTGRREAQDALEGVPGAEARVVTALADGKGEVRALAAQWLGRLKHEPALPALEAAVKKEKQDVAMGAMLDALQVLGQPVEKYLDRDALATQAKALVAKGLPKDLAWFPWSGLPEVRWADGGHTPDRAVPRETLQWMLAQAVKAKSAEPNAVLRKYCAMFDPADRERFGQYVLEAWMAEDLRPIDAGAAQQLAAQHAGQLFQSFRSWPQYYEGNPLLNATVEQITASVLPGFLRQPAGSAIASKGLLAVAAACAGERAAPVTQRYLKEWYGMRAAQGRALIVMLAWIEHPSATQLMLSVGSRFRTKSFQDEATRQAEALAERKGWTLGELADRTIPTAGFDETGTLELSYGDRVFTAHLLPALTVELHSPEGKKIAALPAPRQTDDEAAVKAAKKALTSARKELKSVVQLQTERLYEALCTERTWAYDDWQRYLNQHPLMRHLTRRLAWTVTTADGVTVVRPLDDGTLTDVDDDEVTPAADAVIGVAHDSALSEEQVAAWSAHFTDYEVAPLFQQFGKGTYRLPDDSRLATSIDDFRGHLLETFALRGRATKLGYTRGSTEDAGWFYTYDKRFPTLGLTARIEFSGNGLPEENRTVALHALSFVRTDPNAGSASVGLGDVPAVLLSEAWNDLRLIAAEGPGYDPDWEKKVAF